MEVIQRSRQSWAAVIPNRDAVSESELMVMDVILVDLV